MNAPFLGMAGKRLGSKAVFWYIKCMFSVVRKMMCVPVYLSALFVVISCAQTGPARIQNGISETEAAPLVKYRYIFEVQSTIGFTLIFNGTELLFFEGGGTYSDSVFLNDWMISGINDFSINLLPLSGSAQNEPVCAFSLKQYKKRPDGAPEESVLYTYQWLTDERRQDISGNFHPEAFPFVLMEKASKTGSSAGALPRDDQTELTATVQAFKQAFSVKDIAAVNTLLERKYEDVAAARFFPVEEYRKENTVMYMELMEKPDFAVLPLNGHYSFHPVANGRLVKVMQGRTGFPEAALVLEYRDGGKKARYEQDLYFAKIDGRWVILR
jgi:hypothetical protein